MPCLSTQFLKMLYRYEIKTNCVFVLVLTFPGVAYQPHSGMTVFGRYR